MLFYQKRHNVIHTSVQQRNMHGKTVTAEGGQLRKDPGADLSWNSPTLQGLLKKTHPTHPPLEKENESTQKCQKLGGYVIVFRRVIQDFKAEK